MPSGIIELTKVHVIRVEVSDALLTSGDSKGSNPGHIVRVGSW